jgi:hypothetical protein
MFDGGPLNGGASTLLVIDNEVAFSGDIENGFNSVICIAYLDPVTVELKAQFVSTKYRRFAEILQNYDCIGGTFLPVLIMTRKDHPPSDAAPEPVS